MMPTATALLVHGLAPQLHLPIVRQPSDTSNLSVQAAATIASQRPASHPSATIASYAATSPSTATTPITATVTATQVRGCGVQGNAPASALAVFQLTLTGKNKTYCPQAGSLGSCQEELVATWPDKPPRLPPLPIVTQAAALPAS